ncbi:MAG: DUF4342 domain-containing protein [Patescibacteria group bacterium]|jgi:hypothetical protein
MSLDWEMQHKQSSQEEKLAKQAKPIFEFTGEQLCNVIDKGLGELGDKIVELVKKGSAIRVRLIAPDGDQKFETTLTLGLVWILPGLLFASIFTAIALIVASTAIALSEYRLVFEEMVDVPDEKPAEPAKEQPTA